MTRPISLTAVIVACLLGASTLAFAAPDTTLQDPAPKKKPAVTRHVKHWTTPPGVRTPEQIERDEVRDWRRDRRITRRTNAPRGYFYYYGSPRYYSGRFASNRFGSRIGPCWTQTPIGPVWNCGK